MYYSELTILIGNLYMYVYMQALKKLGHFHMLLDLRVRSLLEE